MRRNHKLTFIAISILAVMLSILPVRSFAAENTAGETGTVKIEFPAAEASFRLYEIGTNDQQGGYVLNDTFSAYSSVDLTDKGAAAILADYAARDGLTAEYSTATDENGNAEFTDLAVGVYLLVGDTIRDGDTEYTPTPVLVELPQWQDSNLVYDVTVADKYTSEKFTEMTVVKVWKNDTEQTRPSDITVQLLKDGKVEDEQKLNKDNNWTYTWEDLEADSSWSVVEKDVPEGYTMTSSQSGTKIGITNTKVTPPETETPESPETTSPGKPNTNKGGSLPKTGQLWWPVCLMLVAGLGAILIGLLLKKKD